MRSFAIIAGLAASVQAAAYGYPAYNVSSAVETPVYETTEIPSYETSAPVYEITNIKTVDCPEPTTYTEGSYTATVTASTVLTYTEVIKSTKTPEAAKPTAEYPAHTPVAPYPSSNGTHPTAVYPTASEPASKPSGTKPPTSEFTGAATQATVGFLAIAGAVAAFL